MSNFDIFWLVKDKIFYYYDNKFIVTIEVVWFTFIFFLNMQELFENNKLLIFCFP